MTAWAEDNDLEVRLLERYCFETASAEEVAHIDAWFREHPDQRVWYEQFKIELRREDFSPMSAEERSTALSEFIRTALQKRPGTESKLLDAAQSGKTTIISSYRTDAKTVLSRSTLVARTLRAAHLKERGFSRRIIPQGIWYGAVSVVAAALILIAGWAAFAHRVGQHVSPVMMAYATANGERATITLTDGSTVALGVASRLEVPSDYAAGNHTVRLVGEALFTVSHHQGMPFTVLAGPTVTRVLGTKFVVRRYGTDTLTTVMVATGKVAVGKIIVMQNRLVEVGLSGVVRAGPCDGSLFDFATGVLALRNMSLAQAIPELDRWYDADIRLGDSVLATRPIEGDVTAGSLADLAERLTVIFDVRVVREGRVLTLYQR